MNKIFISIKEPVEGLNVLSGHNLGIKYYEEFIEDLRNLNRDKTIVLKINENIKHITDSFLSGLEEALYRNNDNTRKYKVCSNKDRITKKFKNRLNISKL